VLGSQETAIDKSCKGSLSRASSRLLVLPARFSAFDIRESCRGFRTLDKKHTCLCHGYPGSQSACAQLRLEAVRQGCCFATVIPSTPEHSAHDRIVYLPLLEAYEFHVDA
jgi:hypothetical protein